MGQMKKFKELQSEVNQITEFRFVNKAQRKKQKMEALSGVKMSTQ